MPDWKETNEISNKKGNVILDKKTANFIFSASAENPGAKNITTTGINISIISTNTPTNKAKTEIACAANLMAFYLPLPTNFYEKIGTKAAVKAPSAKRLLNKFGNLKATKKASETAPAPK